MFLIKNTRAPRIVGIDNMNAYFEPCFSVKPSIKAEVITTPDLDAPGNIAKAWKRPINNAPRNVISCKVLFFLLNTKVKNNNDAKIKFTTPIEYKELFLNKIKSSKNIVIKTIGNVEIIKFSPNRKSLELTFKKKKEFIIFSKLFLK